jgi:hypothetical protein
MFQIVDFSSINDLKFTYVRLQFQKFFSGGYTPGPPRLRGGEGKGKEGKEGGEGRKEGKGRGGEGRRGKGGMGWGEPPEYKSWLRPVYLKTFVPRPKGAYRHKNTDFTQINNYANQVYLRNY